MAFVFIQSVFLGVALERCEQPPRWASDFLGQHSATDEEEKCAEQSAWR
jgi:hypothetical protein